jgi:hypothetical protein
LTSPLTFASWDGSGRPVTVTVTTAAGDVPSVPNALYWNESDPKKFCFGVYVTLVPLTSVMPCAASTAIATPVTPVPEMNAARSTVVAVLRGTVIATGSVTGACSGTVIFTWAVCDAPPGPIAL